MMPDRENASFYSQTDRAQQPHFSTRSPAQRADTHVSADEARTGSLIRGILIALPLALILWAVIYAVCCWRYGIWLGVGLLAGTMLALSVERRPGARR